MDWKDAKKELTKDWTLRERVWYWITFKVESVILSAQIWWKGRK